MLDRKHGLMENLELLKKCYFNLIILKQHEQDACDHGAYEILHELAENERIFIEDVNGIMKIVVPDLLYYRGDSEIRQKVNEIQRLQTSVLRKSLTLRNELESMIDLTRKNLSNLRVFTKPSSQQHPALVNLRA